MARKITAHIRRDETGADAWCVTVPDVPGAFTHGRTLEQARKRAREAVAVMLDVDLDAIEIAADVALEPDVRAAVDAAQADRKALEEARLRATASTETAARILVDAGLGYRDVGALVGITPQRAQQIVSEAKAADARHGKRGRRAA